MANIAKKRVKARLARHARIRKKISGTSACPRLCVRRTLKNMIVQIIDDVNNKSLCQLSTSSKEFQSANGSLSKSEQAAKLGILIAEKAKSVGIEAVVFDRGGYIYHGRVQALATAAREAGLKF
jgi:large subunit ribosomal protein L18